MKNLTIVANWKSRKTLSEAREWIEEFKRSYQQKENVMVVLAASFVYLPLLAIELRELPNVFVGAEDVSVFPEGSHTGEVNASQIKEFAKYVLIGHSETRSALHETEEEREKKVKESLGAGLTPIYFIQSPDMGIPEGITCVCLERPDAISDVSGGKADDPTLVSAVVQQITAHYTGEVLYGGSVNAENVSRFTSLGGISGVVVGKESLEAHHFLNIIAHA